MPLSDDFWGETVYTEYLLPDEIAAREALRKESEARRKAQQQYEAAAQQNDILRRSTAPKDQPDSSMRPNEVDSARSSRRLKPIAVINQPTQRPHDWNISVDGTHQDTPESWLHADGDDSGLLLPFELHTRRLLQQQNQQAQASANMSNEPEATASQAAPPSLSLGRFVSDAESPEEALKIRGGMGLTRLQTPAVGEENHVPTSSSQVLARDYIIEQSTPVDNVANISTVSTSSSSRPELAPPLPETGRRVIARRSTAAKVQDSTDGLSWPLSQNAANDSFANLEADLFLPPKVTARADPTPVKEIRPSEKPRKYGDLFEFEFSQPPPAKADTSFNRKQSRQSKSVDSSSPINLSRDDWDLLSGPLVPQKLHSQPATDSSTPSRSVVQRRAVQRRTPPAKSAQRSAPQPPPERAHDLSWDGWSNDVDIFAQVAGHSAGQQSTASHASSTPTNHKLPGNMLEWPDVDPRNNQRQQEASTYRARHGHVDPVEASAAAVTASSHVPSHPTTSTPHVFSDGLSDKPMDDWAMAKLARGGRGRREGRESRYDDDSEELTADYESARPGRHRDYDRVREKDYGSRGQGRGTRRYEEFEPADDWEDEYEERQQRKREKKLRKEQQEAIQQEPKAPQITIPEFIAVEDLARALDIVPVELAKALVEFGFKELTVKSVLSGEIGGLIAQEYGFEVTREMGEDRDIRPRPPPADPTSLAVRPPVVTIMGHVDHGKTTMLDYLRKSSVAAQEYGGITQHIGAFMVQMSSGKQITFLDTPGHAAFLAMRQRGANATDIVVLVVAADDSVKPQTVEAISHAKKANVPIIVAINKVDKPGARVDVVKMDLAKHEVHIEDFGGDVQVICTSGKTGIGMADLEESILTLAEVLDIRAETDGMAEGWVIESSIKQIGKSAVVLIKRGTLRPGDIIVAGTSWARVRLMRNDAGQEIDEAPPGTPAEIIGWSDSLPDAGDELIQAPDEGKARAAIMYRLEMREREQNINEAVRQDKLRQEEEAARKAAAESKTDGTSMPDSGQKEVSGPKIVSFIVKSDVAGSAEAVTGAILQLGNHEVRPQVLRSGAGAITEWDVEHAAISGSTIITFNLAISPLIRNLAQRQNVTILEHTIIYRLSDEVNDILSSHLADKISFRVTGEAEVLQVFPINIRGRIFHNIAGCRIRNGTIAAKSMVRITRKGETVFEGKIDEMKHGQKSVSEMSKGSECGISIAKFEDFAVGDTIRTYEEIRESRHL